MKTTQTIALPADVAMALKEIVVSTMPKKIHDLLPMEITMWITMREIAKKIHARLFAVPREISFSLSIVEELALYTFLIDYKHDAVVSRAPALLFFLKTVDQKIKTNVLLMHD